jgi:2-polyprenyl-3-methyl-5-hydroxy-6-metoxy-1,4-benzoquinol methylase
MSKPASNERAIAAAGSQKEAASEVHPSRPAADRLTVDACIVCGARDHYERYPTTIPWLRRCGNCGLAFASPQPSDEEMARLYAPEYYEGFGYAVSDEWSYRDMKQACANSMLARAEAYFPPGRLLDVGSALGDLLAVPKGRGWEVWGVERNRFAVDHTAELVPEADVFSGPLEEYEGVRDWYDLVTCRDVIEHLRRPDFSLRQLHGLLRPGGGLVVTTPDLGGLHARLCGRAWVHYHPDHLWYFRRTTLCSLARPAGFEVLLCGRAYKVFNLRYVLEILSRLSGSALVRRVAALGLRWLPGRGLRALLPPIPEGLLLVARKPA